ncbi:hypothetical protein [Corallococcus sp. CA047B]|uniref:hypothetical protein n=1 Tax=Corallococcus sp. CA047B TaxID=2316729 RepID=UPI001F2A5629|nr:hypothetical protein [Corallococcus sp. CA047B]
MRSRDFIAASQVRRVARCDGLFQRGGERIFLFRECARLVVNRRGVDAPGEQALGIRMARRLVLLPRTVRIRGCGLRLGGGRRGLESGCTVNARGALLRRSSVLGIHVEVDIEVERLLDVGRGRHPGVLCPSQRLSCMGRLCLDDRGCVR